MNYYHISGKRSGLGRRDTVFEHNNSQPNDPASGWDGSIGGKPAGQGVYVYVIEVERADGVAERFSGEVAVVR